MIYRGATIAKTSKTTVLPTFLGFSFKWLSITIGLAWVVIKVLRTLNKITFIFFVGKQGLAGAAERMRNLVSQELDVVVSVKEAKKSREQLLKDRTLLSKQLTDLRRKQRVTMTNTEREEMMTKIKDLEDELAMQNVQISELQKQIMDADAQENDNQGSR